MTRPDRDVATFSLLGAASATALWFLAGPLAASLVGLVLVVAYIWKYK